MAFLRSCYFKIPCYWNLLSNFSYRTNFMILQTWIQFVLKPRQIVRQKRSTLDKVNLRSDIRQICFWKKLGHREFTWLLKQLELQFFDKYQTQISTSPSASNMTSVFKGHLVVFSFTFFAYALKMIKCFHRSSCPKQGKKNPTKNKKKQHSIGIKCFYSNTSYAWNMHL